MAISPARKSLSPLAAPLGMTGATYRNVYHYTSYALLVGVPVAFLTGPPLSSVLDNVFAIALPLHGYLGLRSVLVDYVPGAAMKTLSIRILFGVSAVTALALLSLNSNDIGLTGTVKRLWYDYSEDDNQSEEKVDEVTKMKQEVKAAVSKATKAE